MSPSPAIVVMGVSGSGKTTVGRMLAHAIEATFIEGDALHPPPNVAKMAAGTPLNDQDRWPWLSSIALRIADRDRHGVVVTCSALKCSYRDLLRGAAPGQLRFLFLHGTFESLSRRLAARTGHFMPASLLESQLATLEIPTGEVDVMMHDIDTAFDCTAYAKSLR